MNLNEGIEFLEDVEAYQQNPAKWQRLAWEAQQKKEAERPCSAGNVALPLRRVRNGNK